MLLLLYNFSTTFATFLLRFTTVLILLLLFATFLLRFFGKLEEVREGRRRWKKVGEGWRRLEKVSERQRRFERRLEKVGGKVGTSRRKCGKKQDKNKNKCETV